MYTIILALHIFVCFLLIIAVLLQNSKGSDLGAALGGGSGEMFGPKAPANIMNKITTVIAACFLMLSLTLAVLSSAGSSSIMRSVAVDSPVAPVEVPAGGAVGNSPANVAPVAPVETPANGTDSATSAPAGNEGK